MILDKNGFKQLRPVDSHCTIGPTVNCRSCKLQPVTILVACCCSWTQMSRAGRAGSCWKQACLAACMRLCHRPSPLPTEPQSASSLLGTAAYLPLRLLAALKPLASDLRHDCRYHDIGNVGVEHASPAAIRAALAAPRASNPQRQEFTRDHLLRCGLVAELHARVRAGLQGCNASANALPKQAMCVQMTPGNKTAQGVEGGV
jgi:hypothetical protein